MNIYNFLPQCKCKDGIHSFHSSGRLDRKRNLKEKMRNRSVTKTLGFF